MTREGPTLVLAEDDSREGSPATSPDNEKREPRGLPFRRSLRRTRLRSAEERRSRPLRTNCRSRRRLRGQRTSGARARRQVLATRQDLDVIPRQRLTFEKRGRNLVQQLDVLLQRRFRLLIRPID